MRFATRLGSNEQENFNLEKNMKLHFAVLLAVSLSACQTTTQTSTSSSSTSTPAKSSISDERRAQINRCLVQIGKDPLPEVLGGINAPMSSEESKLFNQCMFA